MARGLDGESIFRDDLDRERLFSVLGPVDQHNYPALYKKGCQSGCYTLEVLFL